jgi:hypothetical protein
MKRRDAIIEDLHKLRESIGQAHGFDVERIAATIRRHERDAGRPLLEPPPQVATRPPRTRRRAAQHGLQPTAAADKRSRRG